MKIGSIKEIFSRISLIPLITLLFVILFLFFRTYFDKVLFEEAPSKPPPKSSVSTNISLHYHERAPYYVTFPGGVRGLCAEPARLVFKKSLIPFHWQKTPPEQQIKILRKNLIPACMLGWLKTKDREKIGRFSLPIYRDKPQIAVARCDDERFSFISTISALVSNPNLILLKKTGYSYGLYVDNLIQKFRPRVMYTTGSNVVLLKLLKEKKADFFFIAPEEADVAIALSGIPRNDFKFIRLSDMPEGNNRYLWFSFKVDVSVIKLIDHAIRRFIRLK